MFVWKCGVQREFRRVCGRAEFHAGGGSGIWIVAACGGFVVGVCG